MKPKPTNSEPQFDQDQLKAYLKMTPAERLKLMYELHTFLWEAMPEKNKRAWEKLKERGW